MRWIPIIYVLVALLASHPIYTGSFDYYPLHFSSTYLKYSCFILVIRHCIGSNPDVILLEFDASKQMVTTEHTEESWYSKATKWFNNNGHDIKNLPTLRYCTPLINDERNKVLRQYLRQLYTKKTLPKDGLLQRSFHELLRGWTHAKMSTCPMLLAKQ